MNRNGYGLIEREYHPPPDDSRRREAEWNQYVAQGSPPRSMTTDYPDPNSEHLRHYEDHKRRIRDWPPFQGHSPAGRGRSPLRGRSPPRGRSPYVERRRSPYRERSRSPYRERPRSPYRERSRSPYRERSRSPYRERPRSPYRERSRSPYRERSRSPYLERSRSPFRERSRSPYRERSRSPYRERTRSPYRQRSRSPYHERSPYSDRSRSPRDYRRYDDYRRDDDKDGRGSRSPSRSPSRRDHRREYRDKDDRRRSPDHRERERTWSRGACSTVILRDVAGHVDEMMVREEVKRFGAPVVGIRMEYEQGPRSTNERVCIVEFEGTRDATEWMQEHEGLLRLEGEKISMEYRNDMRRGSSPGRTSHDERRRYEERGPFRDSPPSDTMIVKGLDRTTDEQMIRRSFEYITHFPIVAIRLVRDKFGMSRGFCFVQWKTIEDCKQVLEYLRTATPRFHIEGRHVVLDFSTPQGVGRRPRNAPTNQPPASNSAINAAVQVAEAAIQAAHWSRGEKEKASSDEAKKTNSKPSKSQVPSQENKPAKPATTTAAVATTKETPQKSEPVSTSTSKAVLQPGQYPTPDTSKFQYDPTSGYYYDSITGLYYDANTRYFYNSHTSQYLYWDQNKRNYIPVANKDANQQQLPKQEKEKKEKETKEQKKITAKKIAKDMERWAKAQNKKKEEYKKLTEDTPTTTTPTTTPVATVSAVPRKETSTADAAFFLLEKQSNEVERRAAIQAAYHEDQFKRPDMPRPAGRKAATASSTSTGLVSYMKTSDSESEEEENEEEAEEKLLDWNKMACLLCRRGFPSRDMLQKHKDLSDLHKTNLEQRRKSKTGSMIKPKSSETPIKYRDRAAERRKNFGSTAPPGRTNTSQFRAPVPFEQPTKDGLDETNIGNQMLQKMGWNKGSGLGKSRSGITDPIKVQQRSRGVGLGMRGATYGLDGSEGDYRTAAKKITQARYMEMP